jgi:hypothetical protein
MALIQKRTEVFDRLLLDLRDLFDESDDFLHVFGFFSDGLHVILVLLLFSLTALLKLRQGGFRARSVPFRSAVPAEESRPLLKQPTLIGCKVAFRDSWNNLRRFS